MTGAPRVKAYACRVALPKHPVPDRPEWPPCQCLPCVEMRLAEVIHQLIEEGRRLETPPDPLHRS
jgi:hypothetical protein